MKTPLTFPIAIAALVLLVAANAKKERPPAGAAGKVAKALPAKAYAEPSSKRRILVFSKTAGFRHASIPTGKLALTELGKKTGAFEAVVSDDLANFEPGTIDGFDAIVFLNTTLNPFSASKQELKKMSPMEKKMDRERVERLQQSLMSFIKGGKGFVGIHAATDTFFDWPEYGEMINGYFWGHPWTAKHKVRIEIEDGQETHPLVAMFEGQPVEFKEEIYQLKDPYDSSKVHMLLRLNPEKSDKVKGINRKDGDFGVSWARHWGEGRVFYCSLGHNHEMYWHPKVIRHYLAGIQWAIGDFEAEVSH